MPDRTTLLINRGLVEEARQVLGTKGITDTIDAALVEVVRAERRRRLVERFRSGNGLDTPLLNEVRAQWRLQP